ncbi:MAG: glutamine-hydrolyzing carbamoyl-phosphate synthase small subunit [Armatimonadetes bacterium]|nr:glutamine-hydrolyzing carbamoyl-phosphate synthase small subunit [Armatimonadota bacterium]
MKGILLLEDGTTFEGRSIGAPGTAVGEAIFATSMTGYQEMLTDPSFAGQLLTLTYPLIGNYGVNEEDSESDRVQAGGLIIRQICDQPSNWRSTGSLSDYLKQNDTVAIDGIDTRALTRHLRINGVMMGAISTELTVAELRKTLDEAPPYGEINYVRSLSSKQALEWPGDVAQPRYHIALIDLGFKRSIARQFSELGCRVTILPYDASAEDVLSVQPDGIAFSSGPGDPRLLRASLETARVLIGKRPIWGIGLGHQLLAMAMGGQVIKLKYGHRGTNHPVKNILTGQVSITAQNHGYAVDAVSLPDDVQLTRKSLNDDTAEGLRHRNLPIMSIQYEPEKRLFEEYLELVAAAS